MRSFVLKNILFPSLIHVAMIIVHQNCVSSPPLAEGFNGLIWDKNSSEFVKILSIEPFAKIEREFWSISRQLETHDFRGATLRMTAFAIEGLVGFVTNEFDETVATGIHAEMWRILARMSNFKYNYYMKEQRIPQKSWMVSFFSRRLWFSILALFLVLVFASHTIHVCKFKYNGRASDSVTDFKDHLFYMFSIFYVQGWLPNTLDKHSKILLLSTRLLAWLLFIAFRAKLISHITSQYSTEPFTDIDSFYHDTDYKLILRRNSLIASAFIVNYAHNPPPSGPKIYHQIFDSGRVVEASSSELEDFVCAGNSVYMETEDVAGTIRFKRCNHYAVMKSNSIKSVTSRLVRGFKYKKTINLGILKIYQSGIINYLSIKWLKKAFITHYAAIREYNLHQSTEKSM